MNSNKKEAPFVLGLTGGIGTGKSTAAGYLASRGLIHIDADAISRKLTEKVPGEDNPVLEEIERAFEGADSEDSGVLREDGSLDRKKMAELVFADPDQKKMLEDILFRQIIGEIRRRIDAAGAGDLILLDVPLLFESGLDCLCRKVIVLTAEEAVRVQRVMERDGCSEEDVLARIRNQMPEEEKCARADFVVDNSGSREELAARLDQVLEDLGEFPVDKEAK